MSTKHVSDSSVALLPMSPSGSVFLGSLKPQVSFDAAFLGLFLADDPQLDEVLACEGWSASEVRDWLSYGGLADHPQNEACLLVCQRFESAVGGRVWVLVLRREGGCFSSADQRQAQSRLAYWQTLFNAGVERGLKKLVLGHDGRLIHADPLARLALTGDLSEVEVLFGVLQRVVSQCWPDLLTGEVHDFVTEQRGEPCWVCFVKQEVFGISEAVYWSIELRPMPDGAVSMAMPLGDDRVARAVAFIRDHFHENPNLTTIAQAARVSPYHFHRLFSKHMGVSPKQYLQTRQLQMAQWMLSQGHQSVGKIAMRCGFSDHGHFTATFGRRIGMRPMDYRQATPVYDPYAPVVG